MCFYVGKRFHFKLHKNWGDKKSDIYIHQFQDFLRTLELSAQCACNLLGGSGLRAWLCGSVGEDLGTSWAVRKRSGVKSGKKLPPWLLCIGATHCFKPSHETFTFVTYMTMCGGCLPNWLFYVCSCGSSKYTKERKMKKNIARIANAVQVTICLLVSSSVY